LRDAVRAAAALGARARLSAGGRTRLLAALDERLGRESTASSAGEEILGAIAAIAREGPPPRLPAVFAALGAPETRARLEAVRTFAAAGTREKRVVLRLLEIVNSDPEIEVRRAATRAVARAAPDAAAPAIKRLLQVIEKDADPVVRENAARSLGRIGEASDEFTDDGVVRLAGGLEDSHRRVKKAAAEALAKLGSRAGPAVPAMLDCLAGRPDPAAEPIRRTLIGLGPAAVDQLITALDRENVSLRSAVLDILGEIGPPARKALPRMRWFLDHGNTRYGGLEDAIRRVEGG
jgi:HEAT repeat protein